jgi:hypothetical protein
MTNNQPAGALPGTLLTADHGHGPAYRLLVEGLAARGATSVRSATFYICRHNAIEGIHWHGHTFWLYPVRQMLPRH